MANDVAAAGQLTAMARSLNLQPRMEDDMQVAMDSEVAQDDNAESDIDVEDLEPESAADDADGEPSPPYKKPAAASWRATLFGVAIVVVLAGLVGWLGFRVYQSHQAQAQRSQLLQVARQGALNLTTID